MIFQEALSLQAIAPYGYYYPTIVACICFFLGIVLVTVGRRTFKIILSGELVAGTLSPNCCA